MTRLQDNQRMEDEFLSSVAAEIEAEREQKAAMWEAMVEGHREYMAAAKTEADKAAFATRAETATREELLATYRYATERLADESLSEAAKDYLRAGRNAANLGLKRFDRRDDITTPETTYSFPPRTLSW